MNTEEFNMHDAVVGIHDIRHLIAIMFGKTDLIFIKKVLNKSGYPFGSTRSFVSQLNDIHYQWLNNGKDIDLVRGYSGLTDPFDKVEESIKIKEINNKIKTINEKIFSGEVSFKDGELVWYDEDDSEESIDNLYTSYCEASKVVREEISNCEIIDVWQDNDSAGFTIKLLD